MRLLKCFIYKAFWQGGLLVAAALSLAGCSRSMFIGYPTQIAPVRQDVRDGHFATAEAALSKRTDSSNAILYGAELARVQQFAGQYQKSMAAYAKVIEQVQKDNMAAKIRISHVLAGVASLFTNDDVIPFTMPGYGQVFLYQYQAMNYLALNNLTDAMVNIRRANNQQQYIKQQHYKALVAAQKSADGKGFHYHQKDYAKYFAQTSAAAGKIKSAFENGFTYYLSSIAYQANGQDNSAFVAIKDALSVQPDNQFIRQQLFDVLEQRGGSSAEIASYQRKFGLKHKPVVMTRDHAKVVVVYEQGLVPAPQALSIPVPIPIDGNLQVQMVSIPIYKEDKEAVPVLKIKVNHDAWQQTQVAVNVAQLAAKSLLENYPMIITRAVLRLIAKAALVQTSEKQAGVVGGIVAQLWSLATAKADLRAWLTLPHTIQIWQQQLPLGKNQLILSAGGFNRHLKLTVQKNVTTLVWVMQAGADCRVKVLKL